MASGCSTLKSVFALNDKNEPNKPITNPFPDYSASKADSQSVFLRTKKGDRTVEVEFPDRNDNMSDFVLPVSPAFTDGGRTPAGGEDAGDENYQDRKPTSTDREITGNFPRGSAADEVEQRKIESELGLQAADDSTPQNDHSYLAALDHLKQIYRSGRYEVGLLEVDEMLKQYPTDPKLYQMRGTLLDRVGQPELALKSWNQALRYDPRNQALRRYIEKKRKIASVTKP